MDIIIIGAGSGGLNIAMFMARAGFDALLIDKKPENIGGDCLNTGCVPSKALLHAAEIINESKQAQRFGLNVNGEVNFSKVMKYVKQKQEIIRKHENADFLKKEGLNLAFGEAKFVDENTVKVNNKQYTAKKIIIATGSSPRKLNLPGLTNYLTNENIWNLNKLPKKLLIIGGGPIGIEMAQAFNRLGSQVTVVDRNEKILPKEIKEASEIVQKKLEKEGVTFILNNSTMKFDKKTVYLDKKQINFDEVLVSIGRVANLDLDLEKANIKTDNGKLVLNKNLQTTNKKVYACGDVAGQLMFTHAAELHASILINNFFSPIKKKIDYKNFSWVTYTNPEVATFGIFNENLSKYEKKVETFKQVNRATTDEIEGKLVLYLKGKKIIGGTLIAKNAGELIQELILAKQENLSINTLFNKVYPYPTLSRINKWLSIFNFEEKNMKYSKWLKFFYR